MYTREECIKDPEKNAIRVKQLLAKKSLPERGMIWAIENLFYISSTESGRVLLTLMPAQRHFLENISRYKFRKNVVPKARRVGISTASKALMMYYATFFPDMRCVLVGVDNDKMEVHHRDFHYMYDHLPDFLQPEKKYSNKRGIIYKHGSYISITSNIRGEGANFFHITETDFIPNLEEKWKASFPGIPVHGCIIDESTANGIGSFMHKEVMRAKEHPERYNMHFYGWNWDNRNRLKVPNNFVQTNEEKLLAQTYNLDAEQLAWRRENIRELGEEEFIEEYPINVDEAYRSRGANVFSQKRVDEMQMVAHPELSSFKSQAIHRLARIEGMRIYAEPGNGRKYVVATDPSEGVGTDYAVTQVLDVTDADKVVQVLTYRDNETPPFTYTDNVVEILRAYQARIWMPEANLNRSMISRVVDSGYKLIYRKTSPTNVKGETAGGTQYGWITTNQNKHDLVVDMKEAIDTGHIVIHDEATLNELRIFMRNPEGPRASMVVYYGAPSGSHDDAAMSLMLAYEARKHVQYDAHVSRRQTIGNYATPFEMLR